MKFHNQSIFEVELAWYDTKRLSTEHLSMIKEKIQTINNWIECRMRTLLLVKYRDEPFAKMCIQYPFVATANEE